jgi:DNA-binding GntR family transcriptional regulator
MAQRKSERSLLVDKDMPTLRERTTATIRDAILHMHFRPGQRLVERTLCVETGVSRTSIREALRQLEAEGLVERASGRGLIVAAISQDEARQIYEVRAALEPAFARSFVMRATDKQIDALSSAVDAVERYMNRKPVTHYVQALDEFYDIILGSANNEIARGLLRTLRARMSYLRALTHEAASPVHQRETLDQMRLAVEAARRRDADAMARLCHAFVERSAAFAASVLKAQTAPLGTTEAA